MKENKNYFRKRKLTPLAIVFGLFLLIYTLSLIALLSWGLLSAMRNKLYFQQYPVVAPWDSNFMFEPSNFIKAFTDLKVTISGGREVMLPEMFMWTIIYSIGTCCVAQFTRCVSGYICAKFTKYRITKVLYNVVIIVMILPLMGATGSSMNVHRALGIYDNIWGHMLTAAGFTGQWFLIYYAAFKGVSWEYAEAAFIDGANHYLVFFRIMMPMVRNVMGGLFLLEFISLWNSYTNVVMYLPSYPTVSYGLYRFAAVGSNSGETTIKMAASMLVALPIVILYIAFNKKLIGNVSVGGLKG